ncbi:Tox-REase-5 domain-containing protein [Gordonia sp. CPCC 206044]|uniref:Tox-REase-5 domain-containing protein n=1 Tax=Gordonia sp. CPCC 206044 TaxID=3140793 RepID=UPI003AF3F8CC
MLTRSQLAAWTAATAAVEAQQSLTTQSQVIESCSHRAQSGITELGSSGDWSGGAFHATTAVLGDAHRVNIRTADLITDTGAKVHSGLTSMHFAAKALLGTADDAEADGCIVADTWQVTPVDPDADDAQTKIDVWQPLINRGLAQLQTADNDAASGMIQQVGLFDGLLDMGKLLGAIFTGLVAAGMAIGAAALWMVHHFPDVDLNELLQTNVDLSDDGTGSWHPEKKAGWSERARAYEQQVTESPGEMTYRVPSEHSDKGYVDFDGHEAAHDGEKELYIEAKGPGREWMIDEDGGLKHGAAKEIPNQLERQYETAEQHDAEVEWRVATPEMEKAVNRIIAENDYGDRIRVKHIPAEG